MHCHVSFHLTKLEGVGIVLYLNLVNKVINWLSMLVVKLDVISRVIQQYLCNLQRSPLVCYCHDLMLTVIFCLEQHLLLSIQETKLSPELGRLKKSI